MNIHEIRYKNFIETRKNRTIPENAVVEKHHIIPKSMGGNNTNENLIKLTTREHYIAHLILWKAYGGKMATAFFFMNQNGNITSGRNGRKITSRQYEELREEYSNNKSEAHKGERHHLFGKHHSEETKRKIGKANSGTNHYNFGKHIIFSKEHKANMSEAHKGKPLSEEHKKRVGEGHNKKVKCIEIEKIYSSLKQASEDLKIDRSGISKVCLGKRKTISGYHFEYMEK